MSEISLENYKRESLFMVDTIQIKINGMVSWSCSPGGLCLNTYIVMVYSQPIFYLLGGEHLWTGTCPAGFNMTLCKFSPSGESEGSAATA